MTLLLLLFLCHQYIHLGFFFNSTLDFFCTLSFFCVCSLVLLTAFSSSTRVLLYPLLAEQKQEVLHLVQGYGVLMGWLVCLCWLASTQNSHGLTCPGYCLHRNPHLGLPLCAVTVFYDACRNSVIFEDLFLGRI